MRAYVVIPAAVVAQANQICVDNFGGEGDRQTFTQRLDLASSPGIVAAYWCHGRFFPAQVPVLTLLAALAGPIRWYRIDANDVLIATNSAAMIGRVGGLFTASDVLADTGTIVH